MSKLTDCYLLDNTNGSFALFNTDTDTAYYATRYGFSSHRGKGVSVPFFPFTDVEVQDRCVILLLEAIRQAGWEDMNPYKEADGEFQARELSLHHILTSADHHLIPPGHRIAVAEPEMLGRIVTSGIQRGVVLFNTDAVIGCKKTARTSFEFVLADMLAIG